MADLDTTVAVYKDRANAEASTGRCSRTESSRSNWTSRMRLSSRIRPVKR